MLSPGNAPICHEQFTPLRRNQLFCSPPKRCRYTNAARLLAHSARQERHQEFGLGPRPCQKCSAVFTPWRLDQTTCGANCTGKPGEVRTCANQKCDKEFFIAANPGKGRGKQRYCARQCRDQASRWRLAERFRRYGVTPEQYQRMLADLGGLCAISRKPPTPAPRSTPREGEWELAVDHDHQTSVLRSLVTHKINLALGLFDDDPETLRLAADYIEWFRNGGDHTGWVARIGA